MLVKPHDLFGQAQSDGFALGAFNTSNLEVSQAIVRAAEQQRSPVIVQASEGALAYAGLKPLAGIVATLAEASPVPVVLHLDHGKSLEAVQQCVDAGFTSVMIDASAKPIEDNVALVRQVVDFARRRGVWVEAELGTILGAEGAQGLSGEPTPTALLTNPREAQRFVQETGVDALAVSIGTIHGAFTGQEYIRFELLEEIEAAVEIPLVVHGASGIAADHLQRVARTRVCKINVDTEMRIAFEQAVRGYFAETHTTVDPRKILGPAREAVQAIIEDKMKIFGSSSRAKV